MSTHTQSETISNVLITKREDLPTEFQAKFDTYCDSLQSIIEKINLNRALNDSEIATVNNLTSVRLRRRSIQENSNNELAKKSGIDLSNNENYNYGELGLTDSVVPALIAAQNPDTFLKVLDKVNANIQTSIVDANNKTALEQKKGIEIEEQRILAQRKADSEASKAKYAKVGRNAVGIAKSILMTGGATLAVGSAGGAGTLAFQHGVHYFQNNQVQHEVQKEVDRRKGLLKVQRETIEVNREYTEALNKRNEALRNSRN